jgi:hypothetical protein
MVLVAVVAGLLLAVRSATYPTLGMSDREGTEVRWSDGTVERHLGQGPVPTEWRHYRLWTLVKWTDGSTTFHLIPHIELEARQWSLGIAGASLLCAGFLEFCGRISRRRITTGEPPREAPLPDS